VDHVCVDRGHNHPAGETRIRKQGSVTSNNQGQGSTRMPQAVRVGANHGSTRGAGCCSILDKGKQIGAVLK